MEPTLAAVDPEILKGMLALIATLAASPVVIKLLEMWNKRRKAFTPEDAIRLSASVDNELHDLMLATKADSALLFTTENGVLLSTPGQVMKVTVSNEVVKNNEHSIQRSFIAAPVDSGYNALLSDVLRGEIVACPVSESKSQMLKDLYTSLGIKHAWQLRVEGPKHVIRYISLRWCSEEVPDPDKARMCMRGASNRIASLMAEYDR